jgi:hypothetical protein
MIYRRARIIDSNLKMMKTVFNNKFVIFLSLIDALLIERVWLMDIKLKGIKSHYSNIEQTKW